MLKQLQYGLTLLSPTPLRLEDAIAGLVGTKTRPVTEQEAAPNSKTSSREDASSTAGRDEDSTETPLPVGSATEEMVDNSSRHSSSSASSASSSSFPLIEIRLHPKDLQRYLKKVAPSPETRSAWETGAALPGQQRRLLLTESRTILKKPTWWKPETSLQELYDEGREWWEDRAGDGNGLRLG